MQDGIMALLYINVLTLSIFLIRFKINKDVLLVSCAASKSEWTGFISRLRWGGRVCAAVMH